MLPIDLKSVVKQSAWVVSPEINEKALELKKIPKSLRTDTENQLLEIKKAQREYTNLIDISKALSYGNTIIKGPSSGFPHLALAQFIISDKQQISVEVDGEGNVRYFPRGWESHWCREFQQVFAKVSGFRSLRYPIEADTNVPLAPLSLRDYAKSGIYDVLFEVAEWNNVRTNTLLDPYVLKYIAGSIYAVIGSWDITTLELKAYQAARNIGL